MYKLLKVLFLQTTEIVGGKPKLKITKYGKTVDSQTAEAIAKVHGWGCLEKLPEPEAPVVPEPEKKAKKADA